MPLFQVVDKDSEEAEVIKKYVKNTHATTHNAYDLEVIDVRIFLPLSILPGLPIPYFAGSGSERVGCVALLCFETGCSLAFLNLAFKPYWP